MGIFDIFNFFRAGKKSDDMKYLIAGLGNPGEEYKDTRHNIGFDIADAIVEKAGGIFEPARLAFMAEIKYRGRKVYVIKPTTYMNLSGKAVNYWLKKLNIDKSNLLVNVDDINLDFGKLRIRKRGSHGGHNGLKDIQNYLGKEYNRLRVGVGNEFEKGRQVDYVLGKWTEEQRKALPAIIEKAANANLDFVFRGIDYIISNYNG